MKEESLDYNGSNDVSFARLFYLLTSHCYSGLKIALSLLVRVCFPSLEVFYILARCLLLPRKLIEILLPLHFSHLIVHLPLHCHTPVCLFTE